MRSARRWSIGTARPSREGVDRLLVSVRDVSTGTVLRYGADAFACGATLSDDGKVVLPLGPSDTACVGTDRRQRRRMLLELRFDTDWVENCDSIFASRTRAMSLRRRSRCDCRSMRDRPYIGSLPRSVPRRQKLSNASILNRLGRCYLPNS